MSYKICWIIVTNNQTFSQMRDAEAIQLAQEALDATKIVSKRSKRAVKKSRSKSSSRNSSKTSLKRGGSIERVYLNPNKSSSRSHSAPPSNKSSTFIDPYRKPHQETRSKEAPGWRPMTRMEAYTGRGLYSGPSKTKLPGRTRNLHSYNHPQYLF